MPWDNGVFVGDDGKPDWGVTHGPGRYAPGSPFGPGGMYATADPLHPGMWYVDDPTAIGGVQRLDSQGHVVGQWALQGPPTQGGANFDFTHLDPATGGPQQVQYPTEAGGLFGLGDVWGSVVGAAMIAALGVTA